MATKKKATGKEAKNKSEGIPKSMPRGGKDPAGGLTAKGRAYFAETEGSHLRPGVQGPADSPEKMVRKGSFLRRHFANPRGPMKDEKGEPTRLALSAHAWGEPVPQTMGDAKELAAEGHELLEQYHAAKDAEAGKGVKPRGAAKTSSTAQKSAKAAGKTATKLATKPSGKTTAKPAGKTAAKTATKKAAKTAAKAATRKSTAKSAARPKRVTAKRSS